MFTINGKLEYYIPTCVFVIERREGDDRFVQ